MKSFFFKNIVLCFFILVNTLNLSAQRSNGLIVEGKVTAEQGSVEGAIIKISRDGRSTEAYGIGPDGKYKLELNYNHEFELIFSRAENFPQKIVVNTTVPQNVLQTDPLFPPFTVDVNLFTKIPKIDDTFSENTVLRIYYSADVDNFISEVYYNNAQIKKLIDQAILQSQMIDKEADYLSKLSRAERAELKKEYDQLLEAAEKDYSGEKFLDALDGYEAASRIFPNEQYPKDRIAEINDLLGLLMVADEMAQARDQRLNTLIKNADLLYAQLNYSEARNSYNRALSIDPGNSHANQRVAEIDDLLKRQQAAGQYNDLIAIADNAFNEMLYEEAKNNYQLALEIRPGESHPEQRITEIESILEKQAKSLENQESYKQALFEAEVNFEKQFYDKALASYQNALSYKPDDDLATRKISEVKELMQQLANKTLYDKLIKAADKAFKKENLDEALDNYQKALELIPDDSYATGQIASINSILKGEENFQELIASADQRFDEKEYNEAKSLYQQALQFIPDDKHATNRLAEIENINDEMELAEKYNQLIASADESFGNQNYTNAVAVYNEALALKPGEKYPKDKIDEIAAIQNAMAEKQDQYDRTIKRADDLFAVANWEEAKTAYSEAKVILPTENYPDVKLAEIESKLEERERLLAEAEAAELARMEAAAKAQDERFQQIIDEADLLVEQNKLIDAVGKFREALDIKPNEQYPIVRIEEIRGMIEVQKQAEENYNKAIAEADEEYGNENFDAAKAFFNQAKAIKPEEPYPDEMITKIDSIIETRARLAAEAEAAEQARLAAIEAEKDSLYDADIASADQLFNSEEYENARTNYRSALEIKPEESYPQQRIDEISNVLAQLSAAQAAYEEAIAQADREFNAESFDAAKSGYNQAKQAKPDETYPDEMITKIDSIVETRARLAAEAEAAEQSRLAAIEAEKDSLYNAAIASADQLFNSEEYENARANYRSALELKPEESYPQQRIDEIGNVLAQLSAAQAAYEEAIAQADREFNAESFDAAKSGYNQAKQAKPDETYPDEMITKIDSIVETRARLAAEAETAEQARLAAIEAERDSLYNAAITSADQLFNSEQYENARTNYRSALEIKPEESYPQQRIDEIGNVLAQLSAAQAAYEEAIAQADREFNAESFDAAKSGYNQAKQAKPDETYPDEMITKIDSIVETRARLAAEAEAAEQARLAAIEAEKDSLYDAAIASADQFFGQEEFDNARTQYTAALQVKAEETYPQEKINEIDSRLAEIAAARQQTELRNKQYQDAIQLADNFFEATNYTMAKTNYQKASDLKPEEEYPVQQVKEINRLLEQQKMDEEYRNVLMAADGYFRTQEYNDAKQEYQNAAELKPEEEYPKNQIAIIDEILAEQQRQVLAEQQAVEDMTRRRTDIAQQQVEIQEEQILSESELTNLYNNYVQTADEYFDGKLYNVSRAWYYKAWDVKPNENYPPQRIDEINRIVNGLMSSQRDRDYQQFVNLGDSTFRENQLAVARGWYNQALNIKGNESYPREQLKAIEDRIAERLAGQSGQQFEEYLEKAGNAFDSQNFNVARFWYKKALELRPNEEEVKNRLKEIEDNLQ